MKKQLHIWLMCFFMALPYFAFSTHIVGGTLTYIYNGGSNYTVTLKLYRDCTPGTAAFPATVTITVLGYNGATFTPSKDITMSLGTVTAVPSNLDTCATPPNPMPCTQQGIYTTTVNNLPPNPGGYHLYYQQIARNVSLSNVNATCNCVGESFYAYIPGPTVNWGEDFTLANGTTVDNGSTAWSIAAGVPAPASASINNNFFQITGADNAQEIWASQVINIASYTSGVNVRVDLSENGNLDPNDSVFVYYRLNGGALTLFSTNGFIADDFTNAVSSQSTLTGTTIQLIIRVHYDATSPNSEAYNFDNLLVDGNNFITNNNPVFNLFPPLFLCVGTPFTFDHAATDANGDSLVYSFYNPYNGDNGAGSLDPTFLGNIASFTPVVWQPGYSTMSPLGGSPLNLNSSTGLLTGTPSMLGQFVVGVVVKEYRNGIYIDETLRDFQFNVINCPQFVPAILASVSSCNGNTVPFTNLGGSSGANWYWDFGDPTTTTDFSTLNNPSYTYPDTGRYIVSLTTGYGTNCANTSTAPVHIGWVTANFTNNAPKCVGNAVSFADNSTKSNNVTITSWAWNFGDGGTSALQNPVHIYTTGGTYTVTLTVSTNLGCSSTKTTTVTITPLPIANASANQTVCANNATVTLNGSISNATGGIWTSNGTGTFSPNNTTLTATYTPSNTDTAAGLVMIFLTTTGNGICGAGKDTMNVTITDAPTISNAGSDQTICGVTTATLSANTPIVGTGMWSIVSGAATITNPNSPATTVTGLSPGSSYTFRWTISSTLCTPTTDDVTIQVDLLPTIANAGLDQILCMSTSTTLSANVPTVGSGLWTVVSGTANITTPTSPTSGVTGLVPGTSVVLRWTITQGFCSNSDDAMITVNRIAIVSAGPNQSMCVPANIQLNGTISGGSTTTGIWSTLGTGTFSPNNTTLNATYVLSSNDITNGQVTLILTSTNNSATCPAVTDTVVINYVGFNGIVSSTVTNVSCYGGANGSATINIAGGIIPYTYFWSTTPSQSTQTTTGLVQGTYTVTITDGNGCNSQTSVNITQPLPLALNVGITNVSCSGGSNGAVSTTPTGGTPPYTYLWLPGNQTTSSINNQPIGTYTVTVTDSKNCQITSTYTITQPLPLSISFASTNASCFNGNNGTINTTVSGGSIPYTYSWNTIGATSPNISGLQAGTYTLTITDNAGCILSNSISITQPTILSATVTSSNETCTNLNNGSATVTASGGTPAYSYLWQPGNLTSAIVSNLASGTYTLTVTDANGCSKIEFATITEPSTLAVNFINQLNVNCFGSSTGAVTATPSGGTPNYTYLWMPGNMNTAAINNLQAGTYTVTVTDNNNCPIQNNVTITQPVSVLSVSVSATTISCYGGTNGSTSCVASGGTAPYSYLWMPGNYTTQSISNLTTGTYSVTITDFNGCSVTNSVSVNQPSQIIPITNSVNSTCSLPNGQASVTVSGGIAPYSYLWPLTGGTTNAAINLSSGAYTVLVTDANGCSASQWVNVNDNTAPSVTIISTTNVNCNGGSNGSATASISSGTGPFNYNWTPYGGNSTIATGLVAGTYTLTVIDANGCQSLATTSPAISEPPPLLSAATTTNVNCFGGTNGTAAATASGGTPGYTYQWFPGGSTGNTKNNLSAGTYTVQVTDANNCIQTKTIAIAQPNQLNAVISSSSSVSCFGGNNGTATVNVTGGTLFYNYNWLPTGGNGPTGNTFSVGTYTVNVTDAKGCTASASIVITQPAQALSATSNGNATSCFGASNGSASINAIGGTPGYAYQWFPAGGTGQSATGLTTGNYVILVTDANSCQTNVSLAISQPSQINVTPVVINPSCSLSNGSISAQVSGGIAPYTYLWLPGSSTNPSLNGLAPGTYTLQITDSQNCTNTNSITLTNIPAPALTLASTTNVSCYGGNNGTASISINQGTAPYSINWSPYGGTNLAASSLTAGNYTVNVIDALGCESATIATITQPSPLTISVSNNQPVSCNGGNNGAVSVAASGGTPAYTYSWQPISSTSSSVNNLTAGTYTVNVTDQNNCPAAISVNITQPTALASSVGNVIGTTCYNGSNGSASVVGTGGTFPYTYLWSTIPTQIGSSATNLSAAPYSVIITDNNGCSITQDIVITQPLQVITTAGINDTICLGQSGTITATASNEVGNYYYTWLPSNITNSGTLTTTPTGNTTYTVTATDQNGCVGASDSVSIIVYSLPQANMQVLGTSPICPGQNTNISVQTSGTTGPLTYVWNNGLGNGPGPYTIIPTQPTTYIVTVSNTCGVSVTDSVQILFNPPPVIVLTSDTNSMCVPASIQFYDNSITGNVNDPITSWYWNFGDGTSSTQENPDHTYTLSGIYPVILTVTTSGGCTNENSSAPLVISVYPNPIAAFSVNSTNLALPFDLLICNNQSVGANTSEWTWGDGSGSSLVNPNHLYTSVGIFQVQLIVTSQYGCLDTAYTNVITNADFTFPNVFTPNANGSSGGFYDINSLDNDVFFPYTSGVIDFKLQIFDRWGELIFESTDIKQGWDGYYRGKICQEGVYVWKAYIKLNNGKIFNKSGDITLLR